METNTLRQALERAKEGQGSVVVVGGPPGCGDPSLMKACVHGADEAGAVLLDAIASPAETGIPLGVAGQLFQSAELAGAVDDPQTLIREEGARLAGATGAADVEFEVLHRLHEAVLALGERAAVMVFVDEARYADDTSLRFLLFLARRIRESRVVVVVGESARATPAASAAAEFHAELLRLPHCRQLRLAPLPPDAVAASLVGLVGRQEADALAAEVHEASGGNPLLVRALVQDYAEARAAAKDTPLQVCPGDRFRQAVSGLLRRGELAVLQMAQAFAVAGEDAPVTVLSGAVGLAGDMVPRVIQALQGAGLMHEGRFRNPAVRRAVREDLSPDEATALNRSLAHLLYEEGAPASTVARHLLAGGGGDARWAVGVLEEAADEARAGQRFDLALRYLEFAHELCRDTARRAGIRTRIAGLAWHVRPAGVVRHLPRLIDAARAGHLCGADTIALVWHLLWYGRFDEAVDALERLGDIPGGPDRRTAGELGVLRRAISASSPELLTHGSRTAPPPAGQDPASAHVVVEPRLQGVAVLDTVLRRGADPSTVVHAEQALRRIQLGDKGPETAEPVTSALLALVYADRLDVAEPWFARLLGEDALRGSPSWQARIHAVQAEAALRRGALPAALGAAETALAQLPPAAWGVGLGLPLGTAVLAATGMGRYDKAAALLAQPVPEAMFQTRYGLQYLHARGCHHLATGGHYAALADFASCGELMRAWEMDLPGLVPWRTAAAQAWLHLDDRDQARRLIDEQLQRLSPGPSRTRATTLRVLAATGEPHRRAALLTEAVDMLEACGDHLELARALADLGHALHHDGHRSRARMIARRAYRSAMECKAGSLTEELQAGKDGLCSADSAAAASDLAQLSDAELRVAALAAQGMTNRKIAGRLFITVSTVEQHLTQVYRKLNVKHRKELPYGLHSAMRESA
ncbi:helix-turn-helix transcriptional regulator [Streptomyces sp. NBC_00659]|uniref:helix-turn-helix transcriptional regulator n=1 Tax=Streptomyces sp. NBC_00659 TaxID=2903669 RepID=UPI002E3419D3|nr:helix-turn-helix transcriptional regulator [Streptomyces sp. NBC_00659]